MLRRALRERPARIATLVAGVEDPGRHLDSLLSSTNGFSALSTARAGGLHAGSMYTRAVVCHAGQQVGEFLKLLARSRKWAPYLQNVPEVEPMPEKDLVLASELARLTSGSPTQVANAASSIFLILPELCSDEPEWLAALQRVSVSPRKRDLSILLSSLEAAHVGEVVKAAKGARALPVRIVGEDGTLTTSIANLKKSLNDPFARWRAQIGAANGCLNEKGYLALPPIESVYEYFALGLEHMGFPPGEIDSGLTAPDIWPFIAAALSYQGTAGPCFFLVRHLRLGEYSQLLSIMGRASAGRVKLTRVLPEYSAAFGSILNPGGSSGGNCAALPDLAELARRRLSESEDVIDRVIERAETWSDRDSGLMNDVLDALEDPLSLEPALVGLIGLANEPNPPSCLVGVGRSLMHSATKAEDLAPMLELAGTPACESLQTDMRKAMREIDYLLNLVAPRSEDDSLVGAEP